MERFQAPVIQLAFTRNALMAVPEEIAVVPPKKPFGVTIVAQLDLPVLNMERVCILLDQYASLTFSHHMYLDLNPEDDQQVTEALRQFRAVCMRHPSFITIDLQLPRYYEIGPPLLPEIETMRQFYRSQNLSRYITSKLGLFPAEGNVFYIDYDPTKNTLISRSVREGKVQQRGLPRLTSDRKLQIRRNKMPAPEKQVGWVEPAFEQGDER